MDVIVAPSFAVTRAKPSRMLRRLHLRERDAFQKGTAQSFADHSSLCVSFVPTTTATAMPDTDSKSGKDLSAPGTILRSLSGTNLSSKLRMSPLTHKLAEIEYAGRTFAQNIAVDYRISRFAPSDVPHHRRLQTAAVAFVVCFIPISLSIFFILWYVPPASDSYSHKLNALVMQLLPTVLANHIRLPCLGIL